MVPGFLKGAKEVLVLGFNGFEGALTLPQQALNV